MYSSYVNFEKFLVGSYLQDEGKVLVDSPLYDEGKFLVDLPRL